MKVGDLVQHGARLIKITKGGKEQEPPKRVGTVVAIRERPAMQIKDGRAAEWQALLGTRTIDVLWSNGKLSKNFAENSLEVISESG
jgi:hypothetical protein